jgi:pilus assembly protein CpaB
VGGLPSVIPAGMRAVSVRVDEVVAVAGFAVPGTRVDVLVTLADAGPGGGGVARAALQNVQVLAAGQSLEARGNAEPQKVTVITLLVTPEQAEVLALASAEGQIQLALRNTLDESIAHTTGAVTAVLAGSRAARRSPPPARPATPAQPRRAHSQAVEIYHGSSRTVASF